MKKTHIYPLALLLTLFCACEEKEQTEPEIPAIPTEEVTLTVSPQTLAFDENDATKNIITVITNANWKAETDNTALKIDKNEGTSGESQIQITDAPVGITCKLTISTVPQNDEEVVSREVTISRAAPTIERTVIYNNDFDKEEAVKNTYWPYLDQFDGWKNATGTGQGNESYEQKSVSVRSDWNSDYSPKADYKPYASGKNNLYFNSSSSSFVAINGIRVEQERDFILQFGSSENKLFDYADLIVEVGNGSSWVQLDYTRPLTQDWELTTCSFSLQDVAADGTLGIRFRTANGAKMMRIDDVRLTDGDPSSQIIAFDNTVYPLPELPLYESNDYVITHTGSLEGKTVRNYTMLFDREKHAALWVAYPLHECYRGSSGRTEAWAADPSIDPIYQAQLWDGGYSQGYSRGHQIPSADRTVNEELNSQTFYASNMTPQNSKFNSGIWASLEGKIRSNMCSDTLYVVTGCYFGNGYEISYDGQNKECPVPTHYFKVILRTRSGNSGKPVGKCDASELKAIGFWLEHRSDYPETFDTDYCKSVEYIEQQTGFTFFPSVPAEVKEQCTPSEWAL